MSETTRRIHPPDDRSGPTILDMGRNDDDSFSATPTGWQRTRERVRNFFSLPAVWIIGGAIVGIVALWAGAVILTDRNVKRALNDHTVAMRDEMTKSGTLVARAGERAEMARKSSEDAAKHAADAQDQVERIPGMVSDRFKEEAESYGATIDRKLAGVDEKARGAARAEVSAAVAGLSAKARAEVLAVLQGALKANDLSPQEQRDLRRALVALISSETEDLAGKVADLDREVEELRSNQGVVVASVAPTKAAPLPSVSKTAAAPKTDEQFASEQNLYKICKDGKKEQKRSVEAMGRSCKTVVRDWERSHPRERKTVLDFFRG